MKNSKIKTFKLTNIPPIIEQSDSLFQATHSVMLLIDPVTGNIKNANQAATHYYGWSNEELCNMCITDINTLSEEEVKTEMQKAKDEQRNRFYFKHRLSNGDIRDVEVFTGPINTKDGTLLFSIVHDISELRQTATALMENELILKKYIEHAPYGIFIANENGEYTEVNITGCYITGYSKTELLKMKFTELVPEDSQAYALNHFKQVNNSGIARGELPFLKKDGSRGFWSVSAVKITDKVFLGFVNDITEKKKADEALIESEHRYHLLFEESNDAIFLTDLATGRYIDCNQMALQLTGYSKNELLQMTKGSLLSAERKEELATNIEILTSGKALQHETEITTKNGELVPVEFNATLVTINNSNCILSLLHDISKRKKAAEALKESEERIKIKLQHILSPEGSIADLDLSEVIDIPTIQQLMDNFYELVNIPMAIIDLKGKVLVGVGWQDICSKFHRVHPKACRNCFESDVHLTKGIPDGEFMLYKCKNNMWDMATPLTIGGEFKGNLYLGQFFFEDEPINYKVFLSQAKKYGFNVQEYIEALNKVPRINKQKLDNAKAFFLNFSRTISQLSYSNIKLARAIEQQKRIEETLIEKEELLNKSQEIAHLGSWSIDLISKKVTWSDELYWILGFHKSTTEPNVKHLIEVIHPHDRLLVKNLYHKSLKKQLNGFETEYRIIRHDNGEVRYVSSKCEFIRENNKRIIRWVGMIHDITEIKKTQEVIIENERLLRESQEVAHIGSYSADLISGTWKATTELYGIFGVDKTYPRTIDAWIERIHPDYRTELINDLFLGGNKLFEHEYKIIRQNDGMERWVQGHGKFVFNDQEIHTGLIGTIQDITKRKQAEEELRLLNEELDERVKNRTAELSQINTALQLAEEKYRTIADYTFDWESWIAPDGRFLYVSPSCLKVTGYPVSDFIINPELFFKIAHPDDRQFVEEKFHEGLRGNLPLISFDYRIITRSGDVRWIAHDCNSVYSEKGKWLGLRCSNRDISQRKNIENDLIDSQKKLRDLTQYLNKITEDERTRIAREIHDELGHLITVLKYDLEELLSDPDKGIKSLEDNIYEMIGMVDSLGDSVRKIATELRPAILDHLGLFPAIEWQIKQFRIMTKIACEFKLEEPEVEFNKNVSITIFRILQEILTNIVRHANAKKLKVSLSGNDNLFTMSVSDDGVGFSTIDTVYTTSLGLMGMKERALSIGGELQINSNPGMGTTIKLTIKM